MFIVYWAFYTKKKKTACLYIIYRKPMIPIFLWKHNNKHDTTIDDTKMCIIAVYLLNKKTWWENGLNDNFKNVYIIYQKNFHKLFNPIIL